MAILEQAIPLTVTPAIPWEALDAARGSYISAFCIPDGMKTLNPDALAVAEVYTFYDHILSLQDVPGATKFTFTPSDNVLRGFGVPLAPSPEPEVLPASHRGDSGVTSGAVGPTKRPANEDIAEGTAKGDPKKKRKAQ